MEESKKSDSVIHDFGDEFGSLSKHDISQMFVDIHATISPLNPISKAAD